ncbi:MAG TPA: type II secretion system F family protein [Mycobacteriales bacterium]|jgi:tight adherence protein B|nr:type II secretion system F family protein [Mycobacteriales bacterium]
MGVVIGLLAGLGGVLMWLGATRRSPATGRLSPLAAWAGRRNQLLRQAGVRSVTSGQLVIVQLGAAAIALLLVFLITASLSVAACFAVFAAVAPPAAVRSMRNRRLRELREVWPEVVDNLGSAVRAGLSLPEAVAALATRGPEPLRPAFAQFAADYRVTGRFAESLDALKGELADPVGDRVCESLRLAREVGGTDLGRLLRTLSAFLREDSRTRAELETRQGWTVNAARLAVAAPWAVLLLLATQTSTLEAYDSASGRFLLAGGAVVSFCAYRLMLRIGRLPLERRVLS